jgi:peroxiredoxin
MQFGVLFRVPELTREMLAGLGTDLAERHGNDGWLIPIPASYVVDRGGVIRYAFVDVDFTRRAEPDDIVAVLESLKG